jgi:membrane protein YqaA with SNARE-associated domain
MIELLAIFVSAFVAATLLPFYSEVVVASVYLRNPDLWALIWLVATLGNTLGAVVNWLIGLYLLHFQDRKWFPFKGGQLHKAQRWYARYGVWSLLFAWAPIGGDALTFIAGVMRVHLLPFFILTFIGKGARYMVVLFFTEHTLN